MVIPEGKSWFLSRQGLPTLAHRLNGGTGPQPHQPSPVRDERTFATRPTNHPFRGEFCRPCRGWGLAKPHVPPLKRWAIIGCPWRDKEDCGARWFVDKIAEFPVFFTLEALPHAGKSRFSFFLRGLRAFGCLASTGGFSASRPFCRFPFPLSPKFRLGTAYPRSSASPACQDAIDGANHVAQTRGTDVRPLAVDLSVADVVRLSPSVQPAPTRRKSDDFRYAGTWTVAWTPRSERLRSTHDARKEFVRTWGSRLREQAESRPKEPEIGASRSP